MGKVDYRNLPRQQRTEHQKELLRVFGKLGLNERGQSLVLDMLTESEVTMFARRLLIAKRMLLGQPIGQIVRELHASAQTVRAVDRWLEKKFDAYRSVLPSFLENRAKAPRRKVGGSQSRRWEIPADPYTFRWIRQRYPLESLLLNILLGDPRIYEVDPDE